MARKLFFIGVCFLCAAIWAGDAAFLRAETEEPPPVPMEDPVEPEPEPEPEPASPSIVIGFGDSITVGYPYITTEGDGQRIGGYEPVLEAALNESGAGSWQVLNYGVFGQTTFEGLSRIDDVISGYPGAYILLLEGTNDVWSGISFSTSVYNLGVMVDKSRDGGLVPIISTLTPDQRPVAVAYKNIPNTYNPAIRKLAEDKSIFLCDQYAALVMDWSELNVDGLHPNTEGYRVMGETWYQTMAGILWPTPESGDEGGGGGGGGGCFIATAAFGSPLESHVRELQRFRDTVLLNSRVGTAFVRWYYTCSPPLAEFISRHDVLRRLIRWLLVPLVHLVRMIPANVESAWVLPGVFWVIFSVSVAAISRFCRRLSRRPTRL